MKLINKKIYLTLNQSLMKKINESLPISFPIKVLKFKTQNEYETQLIESQNLKVTLFVKILKTYYLLLSVKILKLMKKRKF